MTQATLLRKMPSRQVAVPTRRVGLTLELWELQVQKGLYTSQRGEKFAIPIDDRTQPRYFQGIDLWRNDAEYGVHRPAVRFRSREYQIQRKVLTWLRDNVNQQIPYWYYMMTLGHDLHVSTYANLFAKHWHANWANPFNPEDLIGPLDLVAEGSERAKGLLGFVEECGWLSGGKVTTAFVSEEISELVSATASEYADFDFHEVGTSSAAEANSQTALTTTSGIARVTGTPTDSDPIYQNVGTITADVTESWEEHGLFNNLTSVAMMDRSLTGGQSVNNTDQVQYTYQLTKAAEA